MNNTVIKAELATILARQHQRIADLARTSLALTDRITALEEERETLMQENAGMRRVFGLVKRAATRWGKRKEVAELIDKSLETEGAPF